MQCLSCHEVIDVDSCYCDMCGTEVRICPQCNNPVSGKRCTQCGNVSVLASSRITNQEPSENPDASPAQQRRDGFDVLASIEVSKTLRLPGNAPVKSSIPRLRLRNKNLGIDLVITENSTIGRTTGPYASLFGSFEQVSSRHCGFKHDPAEGWCVTDFGSTNKTFYDNIALSPNQPHAIHNGNYLKIANLEFFVSISAE